MLVGVALFASSCALPNQTSSASQAEILSLQAQPAPLRPADFARIEVEVLEELNAARENPSAYASNLEELIPQFRGNLLKRPDWPSAIQTQEGPEAVREAIHALQTQPAVGVVTASSALSDAARDLAIAERGGDVGHTGPDMSTPDSRISAHGKWGRTYNENIAYGHFPTGHDVIVDLLVDDGVSDRGHRRNIFNPNVHVAGVGCGPHRVYGMVCVIDQVGTFTPR